MHSIIPYIVIVYWTSPIDVSISSSQTVLIKNDEYEKMHIYLGLILNIKITKIVYGYFLLVCKLPNCAMGIWYQFTIVYAYFNTHCVLDYFLGMRK